MKNYNLKDKSRFPNHGKKRQVETWEGGTFMCIKYFWFLVTEGSRKKACDTHWHTYLYSTPMCLLSALNDGLKP